MTLLSDATRFYSEYTPERHDYIMEVCAIWVDHYNFMASLPWNTQAEQKQFEEEMSEYLCYDV